MMSLENLVLLIDIRFYGVLNCYSAPRSFWKYKVICVPLSMFLKGRELAKEAITPFFCMSPLETLKAAQQQNFN